MARSPKWENLRERPLVLLTRTDWRLRPDLSITTRIWMPRCFGIPTAPASRSTVSLRSSWAIAGLTLAPVKNGDEDALVKSFVRVEAIPRFALEQGVKWGWHSYGEYLDNLEG